MYEIDQVLFFRIKIPKFDTRSEKMRGKMTPNSLDYNLHLADSEWNTFRRITNFLYPNFIKKKIITMAVRDTNHSYDFPIGSEIPSYFVIV